MNGAESTCYQNPLSKYFIDNLDRIAAEDYIPSIPDILHVRYPTTGNIEHCISMEKIILSFSFICVFAVLINQASLQVTVEAVIGGSVVLPCSSTEDPVKLQDINVHWRHNGSKIVYDILEGKNSVEKQDQEYKNRVETLVPEYLRGNFSIKLINLTQTDAGDFSCLISHSTEQKTIHLSINESKAEKENKSTDQGNRGEETGKDVVTSSPLLWVYIVLPVVFIVLIAVIIFLFRKKMISACIPSEEQRVETEMTDQV